MKTKEIKGLVKSTILTILIAALLCVIINIFISAFAPVITNDIAVGQLENDNYGFIAMESWNRVVKGMELLEIFTIGVASGSIVFKFYKFFKTRKEK